jgi:hypothetical protein
MLTEQEYWAEVAEVAETVTQEARDDEREISEVLWEAIDSHQFVIYTAQAQALLAISPNDGAMVEDFGADGVVKDGSLNWSGLAYCAMEADVREHSAFDAEPEDDDEDE